jgi:hypothetical protein
MRFWVFWPDLHLRVGHMSAYGKRIRRVRFWVGVFERGRSSLGALNDSFRVENRSLIGQKRR